MLKDRNLSIDLVQVVAMFGVIGLHTFGPNGGFIYEICVISIPLFL